MPGEAWEQEQKQKKTKTKTKKDWASRNLPVNILLASDYSYIWEYLEPTVVCLVILNGSFFQVDVQFPFEIL